MKNAIAWFEIPTTQLDRAQAFYETVLGQPMRRENMGPSDGAVFAYDGAADGVGGALIAITAALATNSLMKCLMALKGGRAYVWRLVPGVVLMVVAFFVAVMITEGSGSPLTQPAP